MCALGERGGEDEMRGEVGGVAEGVVGAVRGGESENAICSGERGGERGGVLDAKNGALAVRGEGGGASGTPARTSEGRGISGSGLSFSPYARGCDANALWVSEVGVRGSEKNVGS